MSLVEIVSLSTGKEHAVFRTRILTMSSLASLLYINLTIKRITHQESHIFKLTSQISNSNLTHLLIYNILALLSTIIEFQRITKVEQLLLLLLCLLMLLMFDYLILYLLVGNGIRIGLRLSSRSPRRNSHDG